ncbi:MAG: Trk system potassium transporter TrkA [Actinomycetota bacterium]|nr:Trk system potassium transporter TrkA [Actinomycetota bacterium]
MRIVIVGGGADGSHLAERLVAEGDDVAIVEADAHRAAHLRERLDAQVIEGNGASPSVLRRAGVERADILFAVSDDDGTNVLACQTARALGLERTVARIEHRELQDIVLQSGVEAVIDPRASVAEKLVGLIAHPGLSDYFMFCDGSIVILGGIVSSSSDLVGQSLAEMRQSLKGWDCVIASIIRNDRALVGRGATVIEAFDKILLVAKAEDVTRASELIGATSEEIDRVIIIGGGRVAELSAAAIRSEGRRVLVIHNNPDRAHAIAARNPKIDVIVADPTDPMVFQNLEIGQGDGVLALTRSDAVNMLACLITDRLGASTTVSRFNRVALFDFMPAVGISAGVSAKVAAANAVLRFVRRGAIVSAADFMTGGIEALEIEIMEHAPAIGISIGDLRLPDGAVIGAILRSGEAIVPRGSSRFRKGDRVVVLSTPDIIGAVERLFGA